MKSLILSVVCTSSLMVGACGSSGSSGGNSARASLYVADVASQPACDEASEAQLIYVASEKAFKNCTAGVWAVISKPVTYSYHTSKFENGGALSEYTNIGMRIGDIRLTTNLGGGVALLTVSGAVRDEVFSMDDTEVKTGYGYIYDFSYATMIDSTVSGEQTFIYKITGYEDVQIKFLVTVTEGATPIFKAVTDFNGIWEDFDVVSYPLEVAASTLTPK